MWVLPCNTYVLYKAHSAMECALLCKQINPRVIWCFSSETFMGVCRKLALSSNQGYKGKAGIQSCNLLAKKYALGLHFVMDNSEFFLWGIV